MSTAPSPRPSARSRRFSQTSVDERIALIDRIIAAYERREAELAQLIAQEVGRARLVQGAGDRSGRTHEGRSRPDPRLCLRAAAGRHDRSARADRRLRADLAVELADPDLRHQGDLRHRRRLHDGAEAVGRLARLGRGAGRGDGRGGNAARRLQPGHRPRQRRGRSAVAPPRRGHDLVHRIDRGGRQGRRGGGPDRQARLPGTGRQVGEHRADRRRPREGRPLQHPARASPTPASPAMRRAGCWCTRARSRTSFPSCVDADRPDACRRPARPGHDPRTARPRPAVRQRPEPHRDRPGRGRPAGHRRPGPGRRLRPRLLLQADCAGRRHSAT